RIAYSDRIGGRVSRIFEHCLEYNSTSDYKYRFPQIVEQLISCDPMDHISDIKLIRTDTTLDLSQKAEK
ncbi:hypothetical protein BRARA_G02565, partial [Brassica rapa]